MLDRERDVQTKALNPREFNRIRKTTKDAADTSLGVGHGIKRASAPSHQRTSVGALVLNLDAPVVAVGFVGRVIMHVLLLRHVDSCNAVSVVLTVKDTAVLICAASCDSIESGTLEKTDTFFVKAHVHKLLEGGLDTSSLDSAILKTLCVW